MEINRIKKQLFLIGMTAMALIACRKDSGFYDQEAMSQTVPVNVYDYLKSKKGVFDSMLLVVDRLGPECAVDAGSDHNSGQSS